MRALLPFLKDAWRLALPYFRSEERWSARGLLGTIIVMNLALVGMDVVQRWPGWSKQRFGFDRWFPCQRSPSIAVVGRRVGRA